MAINYVIQLKRQHSGIWTQVNPVLKMAEPGVESNTGRVKIGDGITPWNDLKYLALDQDNDGVVLTTDSGTVSTNMLANRTVTGPKIAVNTITNENIADDAQIDVSKLSGVVSQTNGTVVEAQVNQAVVRNIISSASQPSGGQNGDIWVVYAP